MIYGIRFIFLKNNFVEVKLLMKLINTRKKYHHMKKYSGTSKGSQEITTCYLKKEIK